MEKAATQPRLARAARKTAVDAGFVGPPVSARNNFRLAKSRHRRTPDSGSSIETGSIASLQVEYDREGVADLLERDRADVAGTSADPADGHSSHVLALGG